MALDLGEGKTGIFFGFVSKDCEIAPSISVVPEMPGSKYQNNIFKYILNIFYSYIGGILCQVIWL